MKDTMSLLLATAILAAGGLGLYMFNITDRVPLKLKIPKADGINML